MSKENLYDKSDFEVQQTLLAILAYKSGFPARLLGRNPSRIGLSEFDPCNNWADIGPLIDKFNVSLISPNKHGKPWRASWNEDGGLWSDNGLECTDKNPRRAAAICIIKLLESKQ